LQRAVGEGYTHDINAGAEGCEGYADGAAATAVTITLTAKYEVCLLAGAFISGGKPVLRRYLP
jgi:hypothetical protein